MNLNATITALLPLIESVGPPRPTHSQALSRDPHFAVTARSGAEREVYQAFPDGYLFLIYTYRVGGGASNRVYITGSSPFPVSSDTLVHPVMSVVGPGGRDDTLLTTLHHLAQLQSPDITHTHTHIISQ